MDVSEIIKLILTFVLGGGLMKLLNWRNTRRISNNDTNMKEFNTMDEIVSRFTLRLGEMGLQLSAISNKNLISMERVEVLSKQLEREKVEKGSLQTMLQQASGKLKQYEAYLQQIHVHCECPDHEGLKKMKDELED